MKKISLLLCSTLLFGCNSKGQTQQDVVKKSDKFYTEKLIDSDFLKYAETSKVDSLKAEIRDSFYIYNDDTFKIAHIDAEELAEFSFDFFLPNLNKILEKRKVRLTAAKLNTDDNSFEVTINQDIIQLYKQEELKDYSFWDTAPRNFFKQVNKILKAKNIDEQFYLLYGGNDLHVLLLTENQFSIISEYFKDNKKEKPYKP